MNKVRFFGPIGDYTGYGNAVKNFALAFSKSGILTKFHFGKKMMKKHAEFISTLKPYYGRTNVDFYLHGPPYLKHKSNAYKIAYFYWEADRLPLIWEKMINQANELWVPCELVASACRRARFRGRIKIVPTPSDPWTHEDRLCIPSQHIQNMAVSDDVFKFYSIFQWHQRKGYRELLSAYYDAFNGDDKTLLIIKTNPLNFAGHTSEKIDHDISLLKKKLNKENPPKVFLSKELISKKHIQALHNTADCYVAPIRGEGWGVPIHNAMLAENHIISTQFGGVTEWLSKDSASIIKHKIGPVTGMPWSPLYGRHQNWAYPSITSLSKLMTKAYKERGSFDEQIKNAKEVADGFTTDAVAEIIAKELGSKLRR